MGWFTGLPCLQQPDVFHQQVELQRIGMVKIDLLPLLQRKVTAVPVIGVLRNQGHPVAGICSRILCTTVVFPEPVPPAMPM